MKIIRGIASSGCRTLMVLLAFFCEDATGQSADVPQLVTPVYQNVRDLHIDIPLVTEGKPSAAIVSGESYNSAAVIIQSAIKDITGVVLPIIRDSDTLAPFRTNFIILGNRSTSQLSGALYDRYYSLMDLKYPGRSGYSVRSLHNPYGNGFGAILVGGSDHAGVISGAKAFVAHLATLQRSAGSLNVGWTMLTRLGEGLTIPGDIREFETWEASKGYGSVGYFGWNSISKRMAMYYMTGDVFHAREAIRLAFPDASALREIDEIDGERIENKNDPLAGPYHYNAMMLILFWDLIEESPAFSNEERLKVTNAFARRFTHEGTPPFDKETYELNTIPASVGSRHGQWSALSVYTLARYFNKYYPSDMWAQAERAGKLHFASLHNHAWVVGEGDQLNWYITATAPVLIYMIMTGDKKPLQNGVLQTLLKGQEVLMSGTSSDWALNSAALSFFTQAAYLTGDGRWITYLNRTQVDTEMFRLGQSFWPDESMRASLPDDLSGKWSINALPEPMWARRNNNFPLAQSFQNMSYRSDPDARGDFILLDGYNGAYRNPYHTFDILELRLDGMTLLKGYHNQVLTSADGMVEPEVAMDAALLHQTVVGDVTAAAAQVPKLPFVNWRRSIVLRKSRYVLVADELTFRSNSENLLAETTWEMPGAEWDPEHNRVNIAPQKDTQSSYALHSSEVTDVVTGKFITQRWRGAVRKGERRTFFHLLAKNTTGEPGAISAFQLAENAAAFSMPEAAIAVTDVYQGMEGEMMLLSEKNFYGHGVRAVVLKEVLLMASAPLEIDWDFTEGRIVVENREALTLKLALASPGIMEIDGKALRGHTTDGLYAFELQPGRHAFTRAFLSKKMKVLLGEALPATLAKARALRVKGATERSADVPPVNDALSPVMKARIQGAPVCSVIIPLAKGNQLGIASGNQVVILDAAGSKIRTLATDGEIKVMHWWAEAKLLLVGCADEKVIAFDEDGKKKWEFTSIMDPAVYEAGKPYWFKSAYPGVWGLHSGRFDNNMQRAFVGSACTLEVLDEKGQLVKRTPVFWGNPRQFIMLDAPDGSKNLLLGRWAGDRPNLAIVNSKTMTVTGYGYVQVPAGHTFVNGWATMNRFDNFHTDLDGDGSKEIVSAINGAWNRVSVYSEQGNPLFNAQFGPGVPLPRSTMRMMDVGDLNGDGAQEIIVAVASGVVTALDGRTNKIWGKQLHSPPVVLKIVQGENQNWICVGSEDGSVAAFDAAGKIIAQRKVSGRPTDIQVMETPEGPLSILLTDTGDVYGFRLADKF